MMSALWTIPLTNPQVLDCLVLETAVMTELAGRIPFVDFNNGRSAAECNIFENSLEVRETIVPDFLAVLFGHPPHIEGFQTDDGVLPAKLIGKSPVVVFPLVRNPAVHPSLLFERLLEIFALIERSFIHGSKSLTLLYIVVSIGKELSGYATLHSFEFLAVLLKEHGHIHIIFWRRCNEDIFLEPEVKPDAFTQSGDDLIHLDTARNEDVDVAHFVSLDCDCFDSALDFTGFMVAILLSVD